MIWALDFWLACAAVVLCTLDREVSVDLEARATSPSPAPVGMSDDEIRNEMAVW